MFQDKSAGFTALTDGSWKNLKQGVFNIGIEGYWSCNTLGEGALSMGVRLYGPVIFVLNSLTDDIKRVDTSCALPFSGRNRGISVRCLRD